MPWEKGNFVSNIGRKAKNKEYLLFFTKGNARPLRIDKQRGGLMSGNLGIAASITDSISILIEKSKEYVCKILENINDNGFRSYFDGKQVGWEL